LSEIKQTLLNPALLRAATRELCTDDLQALRGRVIEVIEERRREHHNQLAERQQSEFKRLAAKAGLSWEEVQAALAK
tara:strand:+ start:196 stop:426 length:231 start_codon:yes stop_codon:yes gene_type:complete